MLKLHLTPKRLVAALAICGLAACDDSTTSPPPASSGFAAVTVTASGHPALFIQRVDGTASAQIHFTNVVDSIPNNTDLEVSDAKLLALSSPSWDPTGSGLVAVVATLANDQSEIIVMRGDGNGGQVASPNMQIVASDPQWSPDGRKIAYTMSTQPELGAPDLFVTDLSTHTVTRLTTGANIIGAAVRWSTDGHTIYYSKRTGTSTSGPENTLSQLVKVDAASGASDTLKTDIVGQISSIASTGNEVLLARNTDTTGTTPVRALIAVPLDGTERVLVASGVSFAHFIPGSDDIATVVSASGTSGSVTYKYELLDVSSKELSPIGGVSGQANVDVLSLSLID